MLVLVDESLPKRVWREMPGFTAVTVSQKGWSRTKNGALLRLAEEAGFEAFLTADQSLRYQQNLSKSTLRIIVFEAPGELEESFAMVRGGTKVRELQNEVGLDVHDQLGTSSRTTAF